MDGKRKRGDRAQVRKALSEANPMHKRLQWVREKLKLKLIDVSQGTNIPMGCYSDRENGRRTAFYEEVLVLAVFFNKIWQEKKLLWNILPQFDNAEIDAITVMWLMFGKEDPKLSETKILLDSIKEKYKELEIKNLEERLELQRQLSIFTDPQTTEKEIKNLKEKIEYSKNNTVVDGLAL